VALFDLDVKDGEDKISSEILRLNIRHELLVSRMETLSYLSNNMCVDPANTITQLVRRKRRKPRWCCIGARVQICENTSHCVACSGESRCFIQCQNHCCQSEHDSEHISHVVLPVDLLEFSGGRGARGVCVLDQNLRHWKEHHRHTAQDQHCQDTVRLFAWHSDLLPDGKGAMPQWRIGQVVT
jgi:hypothetical protein